MFKNDQFSSETLSISSMLVFFQAFFFFVEQIKYKTVLESINAT